MKPGRPSKYSQDLIDRICAQIANGLSLRRVCDAEDMPHIDTVREWLIKHESFSVQYARARGDQADYYADKIADVGEDTLQGKYDPQAARVAIDALKWTASKLKPKKYGDKLDVTSGGEKLPTPIYGGMSDKNARD